MRQNRLRTMLADGRRPLLVVRAAPRGDGVSWRIGMAASRHGGDPYPFTFLVATEDGSAPAGAAPLDIPVALRDLPAAFSTFAGPDHQACALDGTTASLLGGLGVEALTLDEAEEALDDAGRARIERCRAFAASRHLSGSEAQHLMALVWACDLPPGLMLRSFTL